LDRKGQYRRDKKSWKDIPGTGPGKWAVGTRTRWIRLIFWRKTHNRRTDHGRNTIGKIAIGPHRERRFFGSAETLTDKASQASTTGTQRRSEMQKTRILVAAAIILAVFTGQAFAVGTPAGTPINNVATATFEVGTQTVSQNSNVSTIVVAEILNVTITWQDAANVVVQPGDTNRALYFTVTNTGNGTDSYTLAGLSAGIGGDNFDPSLLDLYFDTNGNGTYDAGIDTQYIPGVNDPSIPADGTIRILVLNNIPLGLADGNLGNSRHPDAMGQVIRFMESDSSYMVCKAIEAAVAMRGTVEREVFRKALVSKLRSSTDWYVQHYAFNAARRTGWVPGTSG